MKAILRSASVRGTNVLDRMNIDGMNIDGVNVDGVNVDGLNVVGAKIDGPYGNAGKNFFYNKHMVMKRMNEWMNIDYTIILSIKHFTVDFSSKIKI